MDNGFVLLGLEKMLKQDVVLILIVVDNGFVLGATMTFTRNFQPVLILIVVDNGFVLFACGEIRGMVAGLNPYCSGQWFRTTVSLEEMKSSCKS